MKNTRLKLPDDLKRRVAELVEGSNRTAHSFMVEAIERAAIMRTTLTVQLALAVMFSVAALVAPGSAHASVVICNYGDVSLHAAGYEPYDDAPLAGFVKAWWVIRPGGCKTVDSQSNTVLNLAFGLRTPNGTFGIVNYQPRKGTTSGPGYVDSFCATADDMFVEGEAVKRYLAPCPSGYIAVPVSFAVLIQGGATMTLDFKPTQADYAGFVALLERGSPENATPKAAKPPAPLIGPESPTEQMTSRCRKSEYETTKAGKYPETYSEDKTRAWCSCLTRNLDPLLTPQERADYLQNSAAFVARTLRAPFGQRNARVYDAIGSCTQ